MKKHPDSRRHNRSIFNNDTRDDAFSASKDEDFEDSFVDMCRKAMGYSISGPSPAKHMGRAPDFICVGLQRAGTTWLHKNLDYHPQIWLPPVKELYFWSEIFGGSDEGWERISRRKQVKDTANYYRDQNELSPKASQKQMALGAIWALNGSIEQYNSIFACASSDALCGEICPDYAQLPREGIARILRNNPQTKILLLLRDPIDRIISHAQKRAFDLGVDFSEALLWHESEWPGFFIRSNIPEILLRWTSLVPPHQLYIQSFDDLADKPHETLDQICRFLGVHRDRRFFPDAAKVVNIFETQVSRGPLKRLKQELRPIYDETRKLLPEIVDPWIARHYGN